MIAILILFYPHRFLGCDDHDSYFTNTQRHRIVSSRDSPTCCRQTWQRPDILLCPFQVYEILARTVYGKRKRAEVGVDRLVNEGVYSAAFPLHEVLPPTGFTGTSCLSWLLNPSGLNLLPQGPFKLPKQPTRPDELNQRQVLHHYWARWSKWYKYQPLDHIREYFGEKVAFYFAWLGVYEFSGAIIIPPPLIVNCYC